MNQDQSFKDFFEENKQSLSGILPGSNIRSAIAQVASSSLLAMGVSQESLDRFSDEVSKVATSDSFISEVSEKIGSPAPGETEDDFVNRAKEIMRKALKYRLKD